MATNSNVFLSRALWTIPNVPLPTLSSKAYRLAPTNLLDSFPSLYQRLLSECEVSFLVCAKIRLAAIRCAWDRWSWSFTSVLSLVELDGFLRAIDFIGFCFLRMRVQFSLIIFLFQVRGAFDLFTYTLIFLAFQFISVLMRRLGAVSYFTFDLTFSFRFPIIFSTINL